MTIQFLSNLPSVIPAARLHEFHPAAHYLYEWETYWLRCPGADRLRVGQTWKLPVVDDLFSLRFENQLGLTQLQSQNGEEPLGEPLNLEVISPKFRTLDHHCRFMAALLRDLFNLSPLLPFVLTAATSRGVKPAGLQNHPVFSYHFLNRFANEILEALRIVQCEPERGRRQVFSWVPAAHATGIETETVLQLAGSSSEWESALNHRSVGTFCGISPRRVIQSLTIDADDSPENRFVGHFVHQLRMALDGLIKQPWWASLPVSARESLRKLRSALEVAAQTKPLVRSIEMSQLPTRSLMQRSGYRELFALWIRFQSGNEPISGHFQEALDLRDAARLYEFWSFLQLVKEIQGIVGWSDGAGAVRLRYSDSAGLTSGAEALFGDYGSLVYNRYFQTQSAAGRAHPDGTNAAWSFGGRGVDGGARWNSAGRGPDDSATIGSSYSVPLRPDFTWVVDGQAQVVMDAKFRLDWPAQESGPPLRAAARSEDLCKMHAYRDALGVRAAVALYPGNEARFYTKDGVRNGQIGLSEVLLSQSEGIGAIPFSPLISGESA